VGDKGRVLFTGDFITPILDEGAGKALAKRSRGRPGVASGALAFPSSPDASAAEVCANLGEAINSAQALGRLFSSRLVPTGDHYQILGVEREQGLAGIGEAAQVALGDVVCQKIFF
jgi:hypothetical protein